jgi:hypothetical protein
MFEFLVLSFFFFCFQVNIVVKDTFFTNSILLSNCIGKRKDLRIAQTRTMSE